MSGVNKAILLGNLGKDPEVRSIDNGNKVANFSLATSRVYKNNDGEKVEETEWHNIVLWGRLAEIAEKYLTKGGKVYVEGRIRTRNYDDKDGNKRYVTEIVGERINLLSGAKDNEKQGESSPPGSALQEGNDLPF